MAKKKSKWSPWIKTSPDRHPNRLSRDKRTETKNFYVTEVQSKELSAAENTLNSFEVQSTRYYSRKKLK